MDASAPGVNCPSRAFELLLSPILPELLAPRWEHLLDSKERLRRRQRREKLVRLMRHREKLIVVEDCHVLLPPEVPGLPEFERIR